MKKIIPGLTPPFCVPLAWMPETVVSRFPYRREAGSAARTSSLSTRCTRVLFCTSTTGVSPVTVIDSCTLPRRRSALSVIVTPVETWTPSRSTVVKPGKEKATL